MGTLLHACLCTMYIQCPWEPEEGDGHPGTGVTDGDELPFGCWKSHSGPLRIVSAIQGRSISPALRVSFLLFLFSF